MKKTHYYLVDTSVVTPGAAVSDLQFKIINEEPFVVHDIKVRYNLLSLIFFCFMCIIFFSVVLHNEDDICVLYLKMSR